MPHVCKKVGPPEDMDCFPLTGCQPHFVLFHAPILWIFDNCVSQHVIEVLAVDDVDHSWGINDPSSWSHVGLLHQSESWTSLSKVLWWPLRLHALPRPCRCRSTIRHPGDEVHDPFFLRWYSAWAVRGVLWHRLHLVLCWNQSINQRTIGPKTTFVRELVIISSAASTATSLLSALTTTNVSPLPLPSWKGTCYQQSYNSTYRDLIGVKKASYPSIRLFMGWVITPFTSN